MISHLVVLGPLPTPFETIMVILPSKVCLFDYIFVNASFKMTIVHTCSFLVKLSLQYNATLHSPFKFKVHVVQ
jgi:hypothetical protein